ncbi:MAG TPA: SIMPL domain-containing protein [Kofleriaceae bacterium]|nr:SIMPL domain-containing protein [Kofleriaceae bacterium]
MGLVRESDAPVRREWFSARLFTVVIGAVAVIWVATVVVGGWKASHRRVVADRTIVAVAVAHRQITPDTIEWGLKLTTHGTDRMAALRELRAASEATRAYLTSHEIKAAEMTIYPAETEEDIQTITHHRADGSEDSEDVPHGFNATQRIAMHSGDIARFLRAFRAATLAAELGTAEIEEPTCTLSRLDDIQNELAVAVRRAVRAKAEADVAAMGGARLGKLLNSDGESFNVGSTSLPACEQGTDASSTLHATYLLD